MNSHAILTKKQRYFRNFKDVKRVLDLAGIKFWLDYGSLLGAVREGGMIEWDTDLDLSTTDDYWNHLVEVIPKLQELGFYGYSTNIPLGKGLFSRGLWIRRYGQKVDIMLYQRVKKEMIGFVWVRERSHHLLGKRYLSKIIRGCYFLLFHERLFGTPHPSDLDVNMSATFKVWGNVLRPISAPFGYAKTCISKLLTVIGFRFAVFSVPSHFFDKLTSAQLFGLACEIPSDVDEYLTYHYGNWLTPKKQFDWTVDDGAVVGYV